MAVLGMPVPAADHGGSQFVIVKPEAFGEGKLIHIATTTDLAGCEVAFRREGHMVWQMQLAREHAAVPLTRDYIAGYEGAVAQTTQEA